MQMKLTALLNANYPGNQYVGFEHAKGHLVIARRADRHTLFVPAKEATPIINALLEDANDHGSAADEILSTVPGSWQCEAKSGRVISVGEERLACYA